MAIKHVVIFKLKEGVTKDDPRVAEAFAAMQVLPEKMSEIKQWEIGFNISDRPIAYDVGLYSSFDTAEDLQVYATHPAHLHVIKLWREISDWNICDFVL